MMQNGKGNVVGTKAWTPAIPLKRPDNIISSDYARANRTFVPSYERECRPCMEQLMANEYQRIWWQERDAWANPPQAVKTKMLQGKAEGSPRNAAPAKPSNTNHPNNLHTKVSKDNNSRKTGYKN